MTQAHQAPNLLTPNIILTGTPTRIAIIGAGLTGLMTAALLERQFAELGELLTIDIFEKSAGVGRLATRYNKPKTAIDNQLNDQQYQFEFGAQFFTAKSAEFQRFLKPWIKTGTVTPWHAKVAKLDKAINRANASECTVTEQWGEEQPRYISSPKMSSWGRALAQDLTQTILHYKTRVAPLADDNFGWDKAVNSRRQTQLFDDNGNDLGVFDWVISTAPSVQASELMAETSFAHKEVLSHAKMLACYTLMLGWQDKSHLPDSLVDIEWDILEIEGSDKGANSNLGRVFIEHNKPQRDDILPSVTIHASNRWSEQHVDDDLDTVTAALLDEAQQLLSWDKTCAPDHIDCHRWRYAATANSAQTTCESESQFNPSMADNLLLDKQKQWLVIGDWCLEGRIESCFEIAKLSADAVVKMMVDAS
ncbi:MAG: NAD(P)-binding protein [Psychrobacter sp.]|nr:NAD(P)-binding protein [Psychrobacter sp.]